MQYLSQAQFPRSMSLHRSLQKGRKGLFPHTTSFLQIGHFMAAGPALNHHERILRHRLTKALLPSALGRGALIVGEKIGIKSYAAIQI
jgi:hypothetical protein